MKKMEIIQSRKFIEEIRFYFLNAGRNYVAGVALGHLCNYNAPAFLQGWIEIQI